jgi:hypothetical protein
MAKATSTTGTERDQPMTTIDFVAALQPDWS